MREIKILELHLNFQVELTPPNDMLKHMVQKGQGRLQAFLGLSIAGTKIQINQNLRFSGFT